MENNFFLLQNREFKTLFFKRFYTVQFFYKLIVLLIIFITTILLWFYLNDQFYKIYEFIKTSYNQDFSYLIKTNEFKELVIPIAIYFVHWIFLQYFLFLSYSRIYKQNANLNFFIIWILVYVASGLGIFFSYQLAIKSVGNDLWNLTYIWFLFFYVFVLELAYNCYKLILSKKIEPVLQKELKSKIIFIFVALIYFLAFYLTFFNKTYDGFIEYAKYLYDKIFKTGFDNYFQKGYVAKFVFQIIGILIVALICFIPLLTAFFNWIKNVNRKRNLFFLKKGQSFSIEIVFFITTVINYSVVMIKDKSSLSNFNNYNLIFVFVFLISVAIFLFFYFFNFKTIKSPLFLYNLIIFLVLFNFSIFIIFEISFSISVKNSISSVNFLLVTWFLILIFSFLVWNKENISFAQRNIFRIIIFSISLLLIFITTLETLSLRIVLNFLSLYLLLYIIVGIVIALGFSFFYLDFLIKTKNLQKNKRIKENVK